MAELMNNNGVIYATDVHERRLKDLPVRVGKAGVTIVNDRLKTTPKSTLEEIRKQIREEVDMVIVDAPCSGTGTLRRSPEIKWRFSKEHLAQMIRTQQSIMEKWQHLVKPGGFFVYMTCSLFRDENESQAEWFSAKFPNFKPCPPENSPVKLEKTGAMKLSPHLHDTDGFFAMRWKRVG